MVVGRSLTKYLTSLGSGYHCISLRMCIRGCPRMRLLRIRSSASSVGRELVRRYVGFLVMS